MANPPPSGPKKRVNLKVDIPTTSEQVAHHTPNLDFVLKDISIGRAGLIVNGKPASQVVRHMDELEDLNEVLGSGSFGIVKKVKHRQTGVVYAIKTMTLDVNEEFHEKKLLELRTLHLSNHQFIVAFYGAFYSEGTMSFLLEYMDCGSLADLLALSGPIPEPIIAKLAAQLLTGLLYLHKTLHVIHRDIKPGNILINSTGQFKITDFGVSGELANTQAMAKSFVGTVKYMAPNRISGQPHSYQSDIWSLGLLLLECGVGHYPYGADESKFTFWQLMNEIVQKPVPIPVDGKFSPAFLSFIKDCHPFITQPRDDVDLTQWILARVDKLKK